MLWPGFVRRSVHVLDQRVEVGVGTAVCAQIMIYSTFALV